MNFTIHILCNGFALCGFSVSMPANWPEGHRWVSYLSPEDLDKVNCSECKKLWQSKMSHEVKKVSK